MLSYEVKTPSVGECLKMEAVLYEWLRKLNWMLGSNHFLSPSNTLPLDGCLLPATVNGQSPCCLVSDASLHLAGCS